LLIAPALLIALALVIVAGAAELVIASARYSRVGGAAIAGIFIVEVLIIDETASAVRIAAAALRTATCFALKVAAAILFPTVTM
jgi:multidrug transporter EmrE-like cation transporter